MKSGDRNKVLTAKIKHLLAMNAPRILLLVVSLILCGNALGQTNEPRSRVRAATRPSGTVTTAAVAPPGGFPKKLLVNDAEYLDNLRTNAKGVKVIATFNDRPSKSHGSLFGVNGYNPAQIESARNWFLGYLSANGITNEVTSWTFRFTDDPGNVVLAIENSNGTKEEVLGTHFSFMAPFASKAVVVGADPELFTIDTIDYRFARIHIDRTVLGANALGSVTIFTADGKSVAYGLQTGEVYPTTISIALIPDYLEDPPTFVPQVRVSGPPGTYVVAEETTDLESWTQVGEAFQIGIYGNVVYADTSKPSGFYRVTTVPPPE